MKRLLAAAALLAVTCLGGCASLLGDNTANDAKMAVQVALTTYADVYQPAVLAYGRLPVCPAATLCHDRAIFAKLAATDKAVTASIVAAQSVLEGRVNNNGQLLAALTAIQQAEIQIASAGVPINTNQ